MIITFSIKTISCIMLNWYIQDIVFFVTINVILIMKFIFHKLFLEKEKEYAN